MKRFLYVLLLTGMALFATDVFAQVPPPPPNKPAQNPIDGGLALLAAAGGGYAIKKLKDRKN